MHKKLLGVAVIGSMAFLLATNPVVVNAAGQITSAQIKNNTVKGKDVKDNSLTGADVNESTLGTVPSAATATNSYTKAEADARYAPSPAVIRGLYALGGIATGGGQPFADSIAFGWTLSAAPTPHYIKAGDPVPAGCSGTRAAPDAAPGHLCIFERTGANVTTRDVDNVDGIHPSTSPFGANVWAYSTATGSVFVYGSWAVRPAALTQTAARPDNAVGPRTGH